MHDKALERENMGKWFLIKNMHGDKCPVGCTISKDQHSDTFCSLHTSIMEDHFVDFGV